MVVLRNLLLTIVLLLVGKCQSQSSIAKRAIQYAKDEGIDKPSLDDLYQVAQKWKTAKTYQGEATELLKYLADEHGHVLSAANLGFHYGTSDPQVALRYFQHAAESNHHASMYNAGRILAAEQAPDWVGSLAYLRAAATLHETNPKYAQESITSVAQEAYNMVAQRAADAETTHKETADIFLYGSLQDLPSEIESLWKDAVMALIQFNNTFISTSGGVQDPNSMEHAASALRKIWESSSTNLSPLQRHLVLDNMNVMLGLLAGLDDAYLPMAAGYAEAQALSPYCWDQHAVDEADPACFNGAASNAISYYRRSNDMESIERVLQLANKHPNAATHWQTTKQTPRVFHPNLTAKPWWNPMDFSAAQALTSIYKDDKIRASMIKELQAVKKLQEGSLRGQGEIQKLEVNVNGGVTQEKDTTGLQRIVTPYIRTVNENTSQIGAGGWAEFGPLFDGMNWVEENCSFVPTLCNALKNDPSLCTTRASSDIDNNLLWKMCGADTVVSILRLRPGTSILPHCGTTNSRLIMHFALEGAEGIELTVGNEMVKSYGGGDGHAIVFDDSFEHSVYHGGKEDRFIVYAVLAHPDV